MDLAAVPMESCRVTEKMMTPMEFTTAHLIKYTNQTRRIHHTYLIWAIKPT